MSHLRTRAQGIKWMFEEQKSADVKVREHCEKCGRPTSIRARKSSMTSSPEANQDHSLLYSSVCACSVDDAVQVKADHNGKTETQVAKNNLLPIPGAPKGELSLVAQQKLRNTARRKLNVSKVVPRWKKIRSQVYVMITLWLLIILLVFLFTPKV